MSGERVPTTTTTATAAAAAEQVRSTERRDPSLAYLGSMLALGLTFGFFGPALTTLREHVGVSVGAIAILFPAVSIGNLVGGLAGGRGYDRGLGHRLQVGALLTMAVLVLAMPFVGSLPLLAALAVGIGLCSGVIDVGGNTLLVWQQREKAPPYLNALHLAFGLGALCAPLAVAWSLGATDDVVGAVVLASVVSVAMAVWVLTRTPPLPPPIPDAATFDMGSLPTEPAGINLTLAATTAGTTAVLDPEMARRLVLFMAGFFILNVGLEAGFTSWIYTYAEEIDLGGSGGPAAAALTATFWAAFTLARLAAVGLSRSIRPGRLVAGSAVLAVVGATTFMLADGRAGGVWMATAILGAGIGPQYASMIAFADSRVGLRGQSTSWFVAASAIGALTLPWVIGQLIDGFGASALPPLTCALAVVLLGWLVVVRAVAGAGNGPVRRS